MQHLQLDNTFWQFALSLYGKAGVAQKLLQLQDQFGLDINVLLYMVWLGNEGIALNDESIQPMLTLAFDWQQNIMQPLRRARREIKARLGDGAQYQKAKSLELAVEQEIIARLYQLKPYESVVDQNATVENLKCYIKAVKPQQYTEIWPLMDFYR